MSTTIVEVALILSQRRATRGGWHFPAKNGSEAALPEFKHTVVFMK